MAAVTEEEIAQLPRWAVVAFAARCARRLLRPDSDGRVVKAVELTEIYAVNAAAAGDAAGDAAFAAARDAARAAARDAARDARDARADAANARAFAATNAANAAARAAADAAANADADAAANADADADAAARAAARADARADANAARAFAAANAAANANATSVRKDFDSLLAKAKAEGWDDNTPVPPSAFPPLEKEPSYEDLNFDDLLLTIDPGSAPPEVIADLMSAIDALYRARGGSGITFREEGVAPALAREGVPA